MFRFLKNVKANDTISAILCVILGILLIIWPGTSTQVVCMVLGGVLAGYGVIQILLYLFAREHTIYLQGMLILGIVFAVLGVWILLNPEGIIKTVPIIMGVIIVVHGLHNASKGWDLKKMGYESWWIAFLFGVLTIVLGIVLVVNPFTVVNTVVRVIGGILVYNGISDIWIMSRIFKTKKNAGKVIDAEVVEIEDVE